MTIATNTTMSLDDLALCGPGIRDMIAEATPLNPTECDRAPILEAGTDDILDGFHRTAGMLAWALNEEMDTATTMITVVVCHDEQLAELVCEHGCENDDALDMIYEATRG